MDGVLRLPREAEALGMKEGRGTWRRKVATWVSVNDILGNSLLIVISCTESQRERGARRVGSLG